MAIQIKVAVKTPRVPNFLHVEGQEKTIPIGDLTNDELRELGQYWITDLLNRAEEQRR